MVFSVRTNRHVPNQPAAAQSFHVGDLSQAGRVMALGRPKTIEKPNIAVKDPGQLELKEERCHKMVTM